MSSVIQVGEKWRAQVRRKGHAAKCKTFTTKAAAVKWGRDQEVAIDGAGDGPVLGTLTIGQVIKAYKDLREASRPISDTSTEHYTLKTLDAGLGDLRVDRVTPKDIVAFATMRRDDGAGPYTVNMDISKLGTVLRYGGAALQRVLPDIVGAARPLLSHLRLIGDGGKRERRPTEDELRLVLKNLVDGRGLIYAEAVAFAACSAMRLGEVCAVRADEIDHATRLVPVMRKHPRKGKVLKQVPLLGETWDIAMRQPKSDDGRLFPLHKGTLSKYFTEAVQALSIPDLHFHDLRHEGTSRLFEQGYAIHEVALVTGHEDWKHLKRYTNLKPSDLTKSPAPGTRRDASPRPESPRSVSRRRDK